MKVAFIFPHQLFEDISRLRNVSCVYILEDPLFFSQYQFHKSKLVLHRASMKYYESYLRKNDIKVKYMEFDKADLKQVIRSLKEQKTEEIQVVDPTDFLLKKRIIRESEKNDIYISWLSNPNFMTTKNELKERLRKGKSGYFMANFYKKQRQEMNILMDGDEPTGGKWSFDEENRKKLPKDIKIPKVLKHETNSFVEEAKKYVARHFSDNPGGLESFNYPINHEQANQSLSDFLENRLHLFGDYEDAIAKSEPTLFHSVLTPSLNIGLLSPNQIIDDVMRRIQEEKIPLNSLEGFVRQIIGWREFMRGIYEFEGVFERTNNHFNHKRKIPKSFYDGTTGIDPIDNTIKKVLKSGYCHHIERLIILGNFMLLCEFDPDEIYRWFMELFIDAYDWVMVPNVYGMTQYADGGLITTKPYISSSNYILKMSDYKRGKWCEIWDALYWNFIYKHKEEFKANQRMSFMVALLEKMSNEKLGSHLTTAEKFFTELEKKGGIKQEILFN